MAGTITAANAVYMLSIAGLFGAPQQLQGFAADDVFDTESMENAEVQMGVDGHLSGGFVFVPVKQGITLQADSNSVDMFETWFQAQQTARELYPAQGTVTLPSVGKTYTMTRGFLTAYSPMADTKKVLQPRKFGITWERVSPGAFLMRKTSTVTIKAEGRDQGKVFLLTEMPASVAEAWAIRALMALAAAGVELPDDYENMGMAAIAALGLQAFSGISFEKAAPLLAEMMECIQIIPDPTKTEVVRKLYETDIEEVQTRLSLRKDVLDLHTGFFTRAGSSTLIPAK